MRVRLPRATAGAQTSATAFNNAAHHWPAVDGAVHNTCGSGNAAISIQVATKKHRSCPTVVKRSGCRAASPPRHKKSLWLAFGMEPERGMARLDGAGWGVLMKNEIRIVPQAAERSRRQVIGCSGPATR